MNKNYVDIKKKKKKNTKKITKTQLKDQTLN